jgi:hypothetical protein
MRVWLLLVLVGVTPIAAATPEADFHRAVYALHERQVARHAVKTTEERGDYEGAAAARYRYVDTRYYDAADGRLLSHIRRDAAMPELIHIAEVNVYDDTGRLVRDFGSITLPWAPLQPVRTFINLHHYNGGLHSFRQYDFFGQIGYESCEGRLDGKSVRISLDGSDINAASTAAPAYKACFDGMSKDWAQYIAPH